MAAHQPIIGSKSSKILVGALSVGKQQQQQQQELKNTRFAHSQIVSTSTAAVRKCNLSFIWKVLVIFRLQTRSK